MSFNPRMTKQERALLKGAVRRVFSRSELRRAAIDATIMDGHVDQSRPRVKTWCRCNTCRKPTAKSNMVVDHITPVIPIDISLDDMVALDGGWDKLVDQVWCSQFNLQAICEDCHDTKTKAENRLRRQYKKDKKNGKRS